MRRAATLSDLREKFGRRLRELRVAKGFTQEQLSEKARLSVDFLSLIERGRSAPSFENLEALSRALDARVSDLFDFSSLDEQ